MRELLIVDGYNIINAWASENILDIGDFDRARHQLATILASCSGYWGCELVIVYDAAGVPGALERCETPSSGVRIIFSGEGISADSVIERLVAEAVGVQVIIATSDAAEQFYAFGKGAVRWPARELLRRVRVAQKEMVQDGESGRSASTLLDRLPPHVKQAFNTMRLGSYSEERQNRQSANKSKRGFKR